MTSAVDAEIIIFILLNPGVDKVSGSDPLSFIQQTFIKFLFFAEPYRSDTVFMSRFCRWFVTSEPVSYNNK